MIQLEERLGYKFMNRSLLETALTHSSYANESRADEAESNERLEFLGDSVLGMMVARRLFLDNPSMPEGGMTRLRSEIVCEQSLHRVAVKLHLGDYMRLGRGELQSGGRERPSILADAVEAVIAAMYLDGGERVVRDFVEGHILPEPGDTPESRVIDYKTTLQELVQRHGAQSIMYKLVSESGPDHDKLFEAAVVINDEHAGSGKGRSKKEAEQMAARNALEAMEDGC